MCDTTTRSSHKCSHLKSLHLVSLKPGQNLIVSFVRMDFYLYETIIHKTLVREWKAASLKKIRPLEMVLVSFLGNLFSYWKLVLSETLHCAMSNPTEKFRK